MIYQSKYTSPLGILTMASDGDALIGLWMETQTYFPSTVKEKMVWHEDLPLFAMAKDWLDRYFSGDKPTADELPLAPVGGDFRQEVWRILCEIPYGETITYGEIAKQLASCRESQKMASQAVGGAVGHNPISIIIPCHRVIGAKGNLTGYTGGLDKKVWLLKHEGIDMTKMTVPRKGTAKTGEKV